MGSIGDILLVSYGRLCRDLVGGKNLAMETGVVYHGVSLSLKNATYACIENKGNTPLNFGIPAEQIRKGQILEMNPITENYISVKKFPQNSKNKMTFAYFNYNDALRSKLIMTAERFTVGGEVLAYDSYQMMVTIDGVTFFQKNWE